MFVPIKNLMYRDLYIDPRKIESISYHTGDIFIQMVSGESWNVGSQFKSVSDAVIYFENILRTREFNSKLEELIEEK